MYAGKLRHDRLLLIQQAQLVWAVSNGMTAADLQRFVLRGELGGSGPMPHVEGVDEAVKRIEQNGGKFVMPE